MLPNNYHRYGHENGATEINVAPLVDMVFILLIFFLVTTSFVKETGITVEKPTAAKSVQLEPQSVMIGISSTGDIFMGGKKIELVSVRMLVKEEIARNPEKPVIIVADGQSRNARLVDVIDECKLAGATKISLASERER